MTKNSGYFEPCIPPPGCFELLPGDADTTNTGRRWAVERVLQLQKALEEVVVKLSQCSNCLVTDPVFDLTGRVSFLSHP